MIIYIIEKFVKQQIIVRKQLIKYIRQQSLSLFTLKTSTANIPVQLKLFKEVDELQ